MIVVGIDPDSDNHGVAIYSNGTLERLESWDLMTIHSNLESLTGALFSIEDVCANNFVYTRNQKSTKQLMAKMGLSIGRCQQAQIELMRMLDYCGFKVKLHKPQRGNWSTDKDMFERITGWKGRSNNDTRSAAFFGFLEVRK